MLKKVFSYLLVVAMMSAIPSQAKAQVLKEVAKQVAKQSAKEAVESGAKAVAKQLIKESGQEAAEAAAKSSAGALAKGGLVDDVANAIARNKGLIVGGTALGTAVVHADKIISSGTDVMKTGINATATNVAQPIVKKATEGVNLVFWMIGLGWLGGLGYLVYTRRFKPGLGWVRVR